MRQTGKEILDPNVSDEDRHAWHATAKADELSDFLRWVKADSPWALHGRDALNVVLARENINLQKEIRDLTKKLNTMTKWIIGLTIFMAISAVIQSYQGCKTLYSDIHAFLNPSDVSLTSPQSTSTDDKTNKTNQPKDGKNEKFGKTKTIEHK